MEEDDVPDLTQSTLQILNGRGEASIARSLRRISHDVVETYLRNGIEDAVLEDLWEQLKYEPSDVRELTPCLLRWSRRGRRHRPEDSLWFLLTDNEIDFRRLLCFLYILVKSPANV